MPTSARGRAMAPAPTMRDVSILGAPAEAQRRERALPLAAKRRIWSLRRRCHAARPPRWAIAHCSAENAAGLRPACFSVYAVLCCPAAGPPRFVLHQLRGIDLHAGAHGGSTHAGADVLKMCIRDSSTAWPRTPMPSVRPIINSLRSWAALTSSCWAWAITCLLYTSRCV